MFGKIKIDGKDYEMNANAATPIRYKGVFHKDFLSVMSEITDVNAPEVSNVSSEIAFIMNMSAKKADMSMLSYDDYIAWLEEIESPIAFVECAPDILEFYTNTMDGSSESKKKAEE